MTYKSIVGFLALGTVSAVAIGKALKSEKVRHHCADVLSKGMTLQNEAKHIISNAKETADSIVAEAKEQTKAKETATNKK